MAKHSWGNAYCGSTPAIHPLMIFDDLFANPKNFSFGLFQQLAAISILFPIRALTATL
jgi:hypothetical protein